MAMKYLVCYDISHNRRRSKVSARLQAIGERIQESVFIVHATTPDTSWQQEILDLCNLDVDRILFLPVCKSCYAAIGSHGQMDLEDGQQGWFII
ncbi:CRISPR-associated endonuclease Cas2 [Corynebacterium godavarianum]|uniref:CRISPR-associated endoribonuclease Cas2 n=2 Tax=Corynebacterium godavarianum TaxID=2054421 RepID=A0ABY3DZN1_9CORY|nr:CRISPR-associated endonuclease Cas2 [Corynebacterium godavarianum]